MPTIIAKLQQNAVKKSRVTLRDFKGRRLIATRIYGQDEAGKRQPTIKGIALTIEWRPESPNALAKSAKAMQAQSSCWQTCPVRAVGMRFSGGGVHGRKGLHGLLSRPVGGIEVAGRKDTEITPPMTGTHL